MVGTAVYHVGVASSIIAKKLSALNPPVQKTEDPAASEADTAAKSPWMWNRGMTFRHRSADVSARLSRIWWADAATLDYNSGTILGRDVVPDVCRISAMSSAVGARDAAPFMSEDRVK